MARPLRIEYAGAWYHVMNRGAGRRAIFRGDADRRLFLSLLEDITETFGIEVHAYCLMGNHYHLLLRTPLANLARAMRHVNGVYTQRYNRRHGSDGALFRGRYKAILVDADSYLAQVSRYIHRNPVEAGIVRNPVHYRWSSYRAYLAQEKPPAWLMVAMTLSLFGRQNSGERYRAFVEMGVDEEIKTFYGKRRMDPVLGGAAFRKKLARRASRKQPDPEIPATRRVTSAPSKELICRETARSWQVDVKVLYEEGRGRGNPPRAVAMYLCRRLGGYALKDIAAHFGIGAYTSVSMAAHRLVDQMNRDAVLKTKIERISRRISAKV